MAHDHDVAQGFPFDVGDDRVHPLADGGSRQISWRAAAARKIHGQRPQFRFLTPQFGDDEIPAVAGVLAAVDEYEVGQRHRVALHRPINWELSISMSARKSVKLLLAGSMVIHVTPASA